MSTPTLRILALDVASVTGWASNCAGSVESGVRSFTVKRTDSQGMRWLRFSRWLTDLIERQQPELVVYEAPIAHHPGASAAEVAYALTSRVQELAEAAGVEYVGVRPVVLKQWATGSGAAKKPAMIQAARERWSLPAGPLDDNEADALLLLAWAEAGFPEAASKARGPRGSAVQR